MAKQRPLNAEQQAWVDRLRAYLTQIDDVLGLIEGPYPEEARATFAAFKAALGEDARRLQRRSDSGDGFIEAAVSAVLQAHAYLDVRANAKPDETMARALYDTRTTIGYPLSDVGALPNEDE